MLVKFFGLAVAILALGITTSSFAGTRNLPASCYQHKPSCELDLFAQLEKIYRPSKEESLVAQWLQAAIQEAKTEVWADSPQFAWRIDQLSNVVVRIPATDAKQSAFAPIALQAHTDMVTAVRGLKPGQDPRSYFRNGVSLEVVDGWLQSKNRTTTIGADDGFGVALMMRYLIDRTLPHPPLELVFTVQEENGLIGATALRIPLASRRLINLDGNRGDGLVIGSQGASMDLMRGMISHSHIDGPFRVLRATILDLMGGHSGGMIHRPRANSIKVGAEAVASMLADQGDTRLIGMQGGNLSILNQIPNNLELIVATNSAKWTADSLKAEMRNIISRYSDEDPNIYKIDVKDVTRFADYYGLTKVDTQNVIARLMNVPHGVITTDPKYPNLVKTSTNLAALVLSPSQSASPVDFAYMGRSFVNDELAQVTARSTQVLGDGWPGGVQRVNQATIVAWQMGQHSALAQVALKDWKYFHRLVYLPGGLETSSWAKKYPDMDVICFGGDIQDQHTPDERVRVGSFQEAAQALARILANVSN